MLISGGFIVSKPVTKIVAGALGALLLGSSAAASVVVVRSLGPSSKSFPPGKTLGDSAKISLKGGDVVTVLGPSSAQTMRGPGEFNTSKVRLADVAGKRGRVGALRAGEVAKNPGVWDIDATRKGKVCVTRAGKLNLWRPDSQAEATVNVVSSNGASATIEWVAGNASTPWPTSIPVVNGSDYTIQWMDTGESTPVTIVQIDGDPEDLVGAAQLLINNGCEQQLDVLVNSASKIGE